MAFYLAILFLALSSLGTSLASAMHGGNYLSKTTVVALHVLLLPTVAPFFWVFCRRGKHADAEMDYLDGISGEAAIVAAYPFGIGRIMAKVIAYARRHPWPHLGAAPTRIQQEITGGFVLGALLGLLTAVCIVLMH